jgi:hypothetical protein
MFSGSRSALAVVEVAHQSAMQTQSVNESGAETIACGLPVELFNATTPI